MSNEDIPQTTSLMKVSRAGLFCPATPARDKMSLRDTFSFTGYNKWLSFNLCAWTKKNASAAQEQ